VSESKLNRRAALATLLMVASAGIGQALVPTKRLALLRGPFKLADMLPEQFGSWRTDNAVVTGIVNPETAALLNRIYSQLLDRVYVGENNVRIMISIAYGDDQSDDSVQLHYPEVCYPAQGFQLRATKYDEIHVKQGDIKVKRLDTRFADSRYEPVTYWTIVGDRQSLGKWDKKVSEIEHGFRGEIVDGLLFRISSINQDTQAAFHDHDRFVSDLMDVLTPAARQQLAGLG